MNELSEREYKLISVYAKKNLGIHLNENKKALICSRLNNRLKILNIKNFEQYHDYLINNPDEVINFTNRITTNYTYFLREPEHFNIFVEDVIPFVKKESKQDKDLRVWCAGCSAGQESNYLAILIDKHFRNNIEWNTELLASDISTNVLEKAYKAIYPKEDVLDVPVKILKEYFKEKNGEYQIIDRVRKNITYRKLNLIDNLKFKKPLHAIFCRNVMIYFDEETKEKVVKQFYDALAPGGFLFISHSETLKTINSNFKFYKPAVYRKK